MIVFPQLASSLNVSITEVAVNESNPVVGSSKNISYGSVISSTPIDVLFLSPPDIPFNNGPPILTF
jgi:hypothetical protein